MDFILDENGLTFFNADGTIFEEVCTEVTRPYADEEHLWMNISDVKRRRK